MAVQQAQVDGEHRLQSARLNLDGVVVGADQGRVMLGQPLCGVEGEARLIVVVVGGRQATLPPARPQQHGVAAARLEASGLVGSLDVICGHGGRGLQGAACRGDEVEQDAAGYYGAKFFGPTPLRTKGRADGRCRVPVVEVVPFPSVAQRVEVRPTVRRHLDGILRELESGRAARSKGVVTGVAVHETRGRAPVRRDVGRGAERLRQRQHCPVPDESDAVLYHLRDEEVQCAGLVVGPPASPVAAHRADPVSRALASAVSDSKAEFAWLSSCLRASLPVLVRGRSDTTTTVHGIL